jgi:hypothetical protein
MVDASSVTYQQLFPFPSVEQYAQLCTIEHETHAGPYRLGSQTCMVSFDDESPSKYIHDRSLAWFAAVVGGSIVAYGLIAKTGADGTTCTRDFRFLTAFDTAEIREGLRAYASNCGF